MIYAYCFYEYTATHLHAGEEIDPFKIAQFSGPYMGVGLPFLKISKSTCGRLLARGAC
jgi:hypothetical protein